MHKLLGRTGLEGGIRPEQWTLLQWSATHSFVDARSHVWVDLAGLNLQDGAEPC